MDSKQVVLEVIAEVAEVERAALRPEQELVAHLKIDSAKAVQLLVSLEDRLGIEIDDDRVPRMVTVGDVLAAVDEVLA